LLITLQLPCSDVCDDDDETEALIAELKRIEKERVEDMLRKVCVFFSVLSF
jgi:hypothetical protein